MLRIQWRDALIINICQVQVRNIYYLILRNINNIHYDQYKNNTGHGSKKPIRLFKKYSNFSVFKKFNGYITNTSYVQKLYVQCMWDVATYLYRWQNV